MSSNGATSIDDLVPISGSVPVQPIRMEISEPVVVVNNAASGNSSAAAATASQNPVIQGGNQPTKYDPNIPSLMGGGPAPNIDQIIQSIQESPNGFQLPQRDIPRDSTFHLTSDIMTHPNFIPHDQGKSDYIRHYENNLEYSRSEAQALKNKTDTLEMIYDELQTPVLLTILFFLFELPIVNTYLYRYFARWFFKSDGNMNLFGFMFKSVLCGFSFYVINRLINVF